MKCIICTSTDWKYLFDSRDRMFDMGGKFSMFKCLSCGFARLSPKPTNKQLKKYYPSSNYYSYGENENLSFFGKLRRYLVLHYYHPDLVSRIISLFLHVPAMPSFIAHGKIMDIGCGSGETLLLLKESGWDVFGMDIDTNAIKVAKKRGLKNVHIGTYESLNEYKDNYFDAIRMYHVIEHIDDPINCMRLAYKKLKKGGEIIIGTPNISSFIASLMKQYWYNLDSPRHLYLFSPYTLTRIAQVSEFKDCRIRFSSAGGIIGSIQYLIREYTSSHIDLVNRPLLILMLYPFEKLLDFFKKGDVIILSAKK